MALITTRVSAGGTGVTVKGTPLTNAEVDANFINLNTNKAELAVSSSATSGSLASGYLYWDTNTGITNLYYTDPNGSQWVNLQPSAPGHVLDTLDGGAAWDTATSNVLSAFVINCGGAI